MIIPDVNLLLYAVVDGFAEHERSRSWLEEQLNGPEQVGLAVPALFGFVRLGTSARVLTDPLSVDEAASYLSQWLDQPGTRLLRFERRHLERAMALLRGVGTGANLTTDAQLAALALEEGAEVCSNDSDFARFPGLRWSNPLA